MDVDPNQQESCSVGKHSYSRETLLSLRDSHESQQFPEVNKGIPGYLFDKTVQVVQPSIMPSFMNKRNFGSTSNLLRNQSTLPARSSTSEIFSNDRLGRIHVSLSLNKDVKLNETENAWRPKHLKKDTAGKDGEKEFDEEDLYRRVRGILNKLTPENFDKLCGNIISLQIDTSEKVNGITKLVFEKAVNEPHFAESYAKLCKRLENIKVKEEDSKKNFRYTLLVYTEFEFKSNVLNKAAKEKKLEPFLKQLKDCTEPDKTAEYKEIYNEEERKIRRRLTGTVCFVGALFKNSLLTRNIIKHCIGSLLDPESEDKLECLCKLLPTVGEIYEAGGKDDTFSLDEIIKKMQALASKASANKISNRLRFMLQDVIDLRTSGWKSKRTNVGPKTMDEIEKATKADQLSNDLANACVIEDRHNNFRNSSSRDNRNFRGFNNKQNESNAWHTQMSKKTRAIDASKLGTMLTRTASAESEPKLGNSSQFMWTRFTSGPSKQQQQTPPTQRNNPYAPLSADSSLKRAGKKGAPQKKDLPEKPKIDDGFALLGSTSSSRNSSRASSPRESLSLNEQSKSPNKNSSTSPKGQKTKSKDAQVSPKKGPKSKSSTPNTSPEKEESLTAEQNNLIMRAIEDMVELAMDRKLEESTSVINTIPSHIRWGLVYNILCEYIHLHKIKKSHRKTLGKIVVLLLEKKTISMDDFEKGYNEFCQLIPDIVIDVPTAWGFVFQFLGLFIQKKILTIPDLWKDSLKEAGQGQNFVKELILHCLEEMGPTFTTELWSSSGLEWTQFMSPENVERFNERNNFQFIQDHSIPPQVRNRNVSEIIDRLKELLQEGYSLDAVTDFLNGNVSSVDGPFIRMITSTLLDFALHSSKNHTKLDSKRFHDICVPLLIRYIDTKEDRELECLFAVQILDNVLEHPAGLLNELFSELYDTEVISLEAFTKWRDSKEEPRGKGVAVKSLTTFFDSLDASSETSDGSN